MGNDSKINENRYDYPARDCNELINKTVDQKLKAYYEADFVWKEKIIHKIDELTNLVKKKEKITVHNIIHYAWLAALTLLSLGMGGC